MLSSKFNEYSENSKDNVEIKLNSIAYGYRVQKSNSDGSSGLSVEGRTIGIVFDDGMVLDSISNKYVKSMNLGDNAKDIYYQMDLEEERFAIESKPFANSEKTILYKYYKSFVKIYMDGYIEEYNKKTDFDEAIYNQEHIKRDNIFLPEDDTFIGCQVSYKKTKIFKRKK